MNQFLSMSSLLPSLFKTSKPRGFTPRTRYYDERKEKLTDLIEKHQNPESKEAYRTRIRGAFQKHRRTESGLNAQARVLIIAALLLLVVYYLYQ